MDTIPICKLSLGHNSPFLLDECITSIPLPDGFRRVALGVRKRKVVACAPGDRTAEFDWLSYSPNLYGYAKWCDMLQYDPALDITLYAWIKF